MRRKGEKSYIYIPVSQKGHEMHSILWSPAIFCLISYGQISYEYKVRVGLTSVYRVKGLSSEFPCFDITLLITLETRAGQFAKNTFYCCAISLYEVPVSYCLERGEGGSLCFQMR